MKRCYNCGIPFSELTKEKRTKEHIPAQTFFSGYPTSYKNQRKTVPACYACNQKYAKIDDYLRDVIGFVNESDEQKAEITRQSVKKIFSNRKNLSQKILFNDEKIKFTVDANILDKLHIKNFKGIYTIITKNPLPEAYLLDVYSDGQDKKKLDLGFEFLSQIENWENWDISGNEKVFRFKMSYFNFENNLLKEFDLLKPEPNFMICAMEYNKTITSLVVAIKPNIQI